MFNHISSPKLVNFSRQKLLMHYHHHREHQPSPPSSSLDYYANHIDIYTQNRAVQPGKILHAHLIITGLAHSAYLSSKLITFYTQCKHILHARKVFDQIPQTNTTRWVFLIGAYSRQGFYHETINLFVEMQRQGLSPNKFIIPSVLRACANLSDDRTGAKMHGVALRCLLELDAFVDSALIDMYSKCGRVEKARLVFNRMLNKDLVAWNAMVSGYVQQGCANEALVLVKEMEVMGVKPNLVTWNALIAGFSQLGDDVMALRLFQMMQDHGLEPDVVSWTSIISGFVRNFRNGKAFRLFKEMIAAGVWPSSFTISSLLAACAGTASLRLGRELHGYALTTGVEDDMFVCSSLVDMYAKCGLIFEAKRLFYEMPKRNTITWNSMIFGYANHGYCNDALELFNLMVKQKDVKPDHLTFIAVITACSHAGMVGVGWNLFHFMQTEYNIEPRLEHYACMVDVLGRAGELIDAYNFIMRMPIRPDSFVWGALLGACRNHGNVELADIAARCLYELEPGSAGTCVMLSNLYADVGNWLESETLKKRVKKKRFRNAAHSWIETV